MKEEVRAGAHVSVQPDAEALADAAARRFVEAAHRAIEARGRFMAALSGGSTPLPAYRRLAEIGADLDWERIHLFWGDERLVPPGDPASNYGHVRDALLTRVRALPAANVHRVWTELGPEAAADYEAVVRRVFGVAGDAVPRFDLVLLGLGADGHTASLFPESEVLRERTRLVAPAHREGGPSRVTFTYPLLEAARSVVFLVSGEDKAATLGRVLAGGAAAERLPAARVRPHDGEVTWLVDAAAASRLTDPRSKG